MLQKLLEKDSSKSKCPESSKAWKSHDVSNPYRGSNYPPCPVAVPQVLILSHQLFIDEII
jgi:hypothetical protein